MMNQIPKTNIIYNRIVGFKTYFNEGAIMIFLDKITHINAG